MFRLAFIAFLLLTASPLRAEVTESGEHGFTVSHSITTGAEPFVVYRTMTSHIDQWWSADHSWSGDAGNLYMEVEQGGCFCERLPESGRVEHLRIIYFSPGKELRFDGALGPLQTMAALRAWQLERGGTALHQAENPAQSDRGEDHHADVADERDEVTHADRAGCRHRTTQREDRSV